MKKSTGSSDNEENVEFTSKDVENLIDICERRHPGECIDLLLTNQWPKFVERLNNQSLVFFLYYSL